jgi:hypothetical protein
MCVVGILGKNSGYVLLKQKTPFWERVSTLYVARNNLCTSGYTKGKGNSLFKLSVIKIGIKKPKQSI